MTDVPLSTFITHDGSRHFLSLTENIPPDALLRALETMSDIGVTEFLETISESWIDFDFRDHKFTINNQFGEYWFFSEDAGCPDTILIELRKRFATILPPH